MREHPDLSKIPSYVEDTGEVNWALEEAIEKEVPMPAITQSVLALFASRGGDRTPPAPSPFFEINSAGIPSARGRTSPS